LTATMECVYWSWKLTTVKSVSWRSNWTLHWSYLQCATSSPPTSNRETE
jgi:hypothetical protein